MDLIQETVKIPDGFGWIQAAHAWSVDLRTKKLRSLVSPNLWHPGEIKEAVCMVAYLEVSRRQLGPPVVVRQWTPPPCENPPGRDCKCGYWGLKNPLTFLEGSTPWLFGDAVFGLVELSGRIIEGKLGYRGQLARVAGFVRFGDVPSQELERLADLYDVPLHDGAAWMEGKDVA